MTYKLNKLKWVLTSETSDRGEEKPNHVSEKKLDLLACSTSHWNRKVSVLFFSLF